MQSIHNGVKHSCEYCEYKATWTSHLNKHVSLFIMELDIVVSIVTIRRLKKVVFADMCSLSIVELNIIVSIVNIKQVQKQKI